MRESSPRLILREKAVAEMQRPFFAWKNRGRRRGCGKLSGVRKPLPLGATATTAASGGNREELLGQRPAGCERQRSRRWEPQPGQWHAAGVTERASPARKSRCTAIGRLFVRAIRSQCKSCLAASLPSQALRASSPRGRALGEGKRHLYNQKSPRHDAERAGGFSYKAEGCGNSPPWGLVR